MNTPLNRINRVNQPTTLKTQRDPTHIPKNYPTDQRGLTLIELMIAIAIGITFVLGAVIFLVSGQQSFRAQNSGSRIQENARFAMDILQEHVRMAGYNDNMGLLELPATVYRDACDALNPCSDDTATDQGDRIAIALRVPHGAPQDCLGTALAPNEHVVNVFWVQQRAASGDGLAVSSLYCRSFNPEITTWPDAWHGTAQPLVDGIEQIQVQYGLGTVTNTASGRHVNVDRYLSATDVQTAGRWDDVRAVRIALLVSDGADQRDDTSIQSATVAPNYQTFTLLDGAAITPGDERIRKVFSRTVSMNNALVDARRAP